jgi:hypothetical protein
MNNTQTNKLNSHEATDKVLVKYHDTWTALPAFSASVEAFRSVVAQIRGVGADRATSTTGLTQTKADKKRLMAELALTLAGSGFAYANKQKDKTLQAMFKNSFSEPSGRSDNKSLDRCQAIHNQLVKLLPSLGDFQITNADVEELHVAIQAFKDAIGEKGSTKGTNVANTRRLSLLFSEADNLLKNELDKLMLRFRKSNPEFYNAYANARSVVDLGGGKAKKVVPITLKAA